MEGHRGQTLHDQLRPGLLLVFNRAVISAPIPNPSTGTPSRLPPPGMTCTSIALTSPRNRNQPGGRSTEYRARPGEPWRRISIRLDNVMLRLYDRIKRALNLDDRLPAACWPGWNVYSTEEPTDPSVLLQETARWAECGGRTSTTYASGTPIRFTT